MARSSGLASEPSGPSIDLLAHSTSSARIVPTRMGGVSYSLWTWSNCHPVAQNPGAGPGQAGQHVQHRDVEGPYPRGLDDANGPASGRGRVGQEDSTKPRGLPLDQQGERPDVIGIHQFGAGHQGDRYRFDATCRLMRSPSKAKEPDAQPNDQRTRP